MKSHLAKTSVNALNKWSYLLALLLLLVAQPTQAISCQVEFRAKRTVEDSRWFGSVQRPEFKTGIVSGEGETVADCEQSALASITQQGWEITYQKPLPIPTASESPQTNEQSVF